MVTWKNITISTPDGSQHKAMAPEIISASRSTDIPGCYADWFINRLKEGYLIWTNPFNQRHSYVSFANTRFIVFWTKEASPIIPHLHVLKDLDIGYYFQYTLNDYEKEGFEPNIADLKRRIERFKELSILIGKERVIWRFDPIILSDTISPKEILRRFEHIGNEISAFTEKCVISFVDIDNYKKVRANTQKDGIRECSLSEMKEIAAEISKFAKEWGIQVATCGEEISLEEYGISHNRCIDGDLILRLKPNDPNLNAFLHKNNKKDQGQRAACGCIASKDIGQYNTCIHSCIYCYANRTPDLAQKNYQKHIENPSAETITGDCVSVNSEQKNEKDTKSAEQASLFDYGDAN